MREGNNSFRFLPRHSRIASPVIPAKAGIHKRAPRQNQDLRDYRIFRILTGARHSTEKRNLSEAKS